MMKKTFKASLLILLLVSLLSAAPVTSHAQPLVVTVDGVNVNLDWSAMPAAPSYTLYYALDDGLGNILLDTIGSIEMGGNKSLYVPGLPSGLIIYTAILAHASGGDVASNIAKFMGFGGTIAYPQSGDILMQVSDPQGIGNYELKGARNADGTTNTISQLSYNGTSGNVAENFILFFENNRAVSCRFGDNSVIAFDYHEDGSLSCRQVSTAAGSGISLLAVTADNPDIDCSQGRDDYKKMIDKEFLLDSLDYWSSNSPRKYSPRVEMRLKERGAVSGSFVDFLSNFVNLIHSEGAPCPPNIDKDVIVHFFHLMCEYQIGILEEYKEELLNNYDRLCSGQFRVPADMGDISCPVPDGAELRRYDHDTAYYLNGHRVGPQEIWMRNNNTDYYLAERLCFNAAGQANGWNIVYRENGMMDYANHWKNDQLDGADYRFYDNGSLHVETTYRNDSPIHRIIYHEDGTIKAECDYSEEEGWLGPCGQQYW